MASELGAGRRCHHRWTDIQRGGREDVSARLEGRGVDPVANYLRLQKTPPADSSLQLGSTGIDRVFPPCGDGLRKYWPKCAAVHRGSLQALVARPEAHGVICAYLRAEVHAPYLTRRAYPSSFAVVIACQHSIRPWLAASRTARGRRSGSLEWRRSYLRSQKLILSIGGRRWRGQ